MEEKLRYGKRKPFNNEKWTRNPIGGGFPTGIQKKFRWHDGHGRQFTAGGLLPYDDEGIWVIGEKKTKDTEIEWTDPGGKYKFEDCDIYTTILREFSEELYNSSNISRECIIHIKNTHTPTYVNGHQNKPVYICYIVHVRELEKYGVTLNPRMFNKYREKALSENPDVPSEFYSSVKLKHILFDDIEVVNLSYRLRRILKYGTLHNKLSTNTKNISLGGEVQVFSPEDKRKSPNNVTLPIEEENLSVIYNVKRAC